MKKEKEELSVICCNVVVVGKSRDESTEGNSVKGKKGKGRILI